jgi:hypothetical protein
MKRSDACIILFAVAAGLATGCVSVNGSIKDSASNTTVVKEMRVFPTGSLKVLDGGAIRSISLNVIKKLSIDPSEMKSVDGDLYYGATIIFRDDNAAALSFGAENKKKGVYVSVGSALQGKSKGGQYSIGIEKVAEIEFLY